MTPTLHQLHQFSQRTISRLRTEIPPRGRMPAALARELALAETLPVVLGYLRSVRTGKGALLTDLMIGDGILAVDPPLSPAGADSPAPASIKAALRAETPPVNDCVGQPPSLEAERRGELSEDDIEARTDRAATAFAKEMLDGGFVIGSACDGKEDAL